MKISGGGRYFSGTYWGYYASTEALQVCCHWEPRFQRIWLTFEWQMRNGLNKYPKNRQMSRDRWSLDIICLLRVSRLRLHYVWRNFIRKLNFFSQTLAYIKSLPCNEFHCVFSLDATKLHNIPEQNWRHNSQNWRHNSPDSCDSLSTPIYNNFIITELMKNNTLLCSPV